MRWQLPSYRGADWPEVTACTYPGCPMRHRLATAPELPWTCDSHADPYQDANYREVVADVLAEQEVAALTEPPTATTEPTPRRYHVKPTRRLDPDWKPESAA